jgi:hypothetical protein
MTDRLGGFVRHGVIVADSGDVAWIRAVNAQNCAPDPSLILRTANRPEYAALADDEIKLAIATSIIVVAAGSTFIRSRRDGEPLLQVRIGDIERAEGSQSAPDAFCSSRYRHRGSGGFAQRISARSLLPPARIACVPAPAS